MCCEFQAFFEFSPRLFHERITMAATFQHSWFDSAGTVRRLKGCDLL